MFNNVLISCGGDGLVKFGELVVILMLNVNILFEILKLMMITLQNHVMIKEVIY